MVLLAACAVIFIMHEAYAQQQLAEPAVNENINAELNSNGIAYITHEVFNKQLDSPVALIDGTVSEIRVTDMEGNAIEYTFSNSDGTIYVEDGNDYAVIKYKLEDALLKENGAWVWAVNHPGSIKFSYPEGVKLVFINDSPVSINEKSKYIQCHGCLMYMTYVIDEPEYVLEIEWEDRIFMPKVRTVGSIDSVDFKQGEKSISFDYVGEHFVTMEMPQELLWNPYQVFLGDTQILSHSIEMEDGTVQITFKPAESGTITIIGISVIPEIPVAALVFVTIAGMSSAIIVGRKYSSLPLL